MAVTRKQKEETLTKIKKILDDAESVTFVNFHGLSVSHTTELRNALRNNGVGYMVAKKTLVKKALGESGAQGDMPALPGELAIAYGAETTPARGVYEFAKRHEGKLAILGGIFEGRFLSQEAMMEIATIPPLDVLRGMFVNIIFSPVQRCAIALDQIARVRN